MPLDIKARIRSATGAGLQKESLLFNGDLHALVNQEEAVSREQFLNADERLSVDRVHAAQARRLLLLAVKALEGWTVSLSRWILQAAANDGMTQQEAQAIYSNRRTNNIHLGEEHAHHVEKLALAVFSGRSLRAEEYHRSISSADGRSACSEARCCCVTQCEMATRKTRICAASTQSTLSTEGVLPAVVRGRW